VYLTALVLVVWSDPGGKPSPAIITVCWWQVYLLLWFWLFGLTLVAGLHLLYRLTVILIPPFRCQTFVSNVFM
jgi:hypothetical protein